MELIQKYDDEAIYTILTAWVENSLIDNNEDISGVEEIDIFNIVVENTTKYSIEGKCRLLLYGEDDDAEYETDFVILFDEDNLVEDVKLSIESMVEGQF